ncbi:MAG: hypothetical protein IJW00_08095 [Clostridia bacterium]|nr:hypothetical protein [Clostridia bacterium]
MNKETLTMEGIRSDLMKMLHDQVSNQANWRFSYIVPVTALAVLAGVLTRNPFIGIAVFCIAAYHIVRFIMEYQEYQKEKRAIVSAIEHDEISISTEIFSHTANEVIYEPHSVGKRSDVTKTITRYYFNGGASWRVPRCAKHYEWSKEYYISSKGLENISLKGDEFYFVSLQKYHDIAYIYPRKNFEFDPNSEK